MVSYLDQTGLEHTLEKLRNQMYPVGSLYFSTNSTSPATIYGGTRERYGKGRTLVSVNESDTDFTAGKTGGEKTSTHRHWLPFGKESDTENFDTRSSRYNSEIESRILSNVTRSLYGSVSSGQGAMEENTSYDAEIKLLQPYISVYIWRRTA
ncbi:phage baseplate protein [uncultured Bifidobacterium sp.]|uniref:phage baseplate protein n=1 Tax=uncultured Bifidobacterium sp. TaxID=165187 RepID=UPI0025926F9C|nr:hypothetical protein [uncultured Bifidobacterium sp.]